MRRHIRPGCETHQKVPGVGLEPTRPFGPVLLRHLRLACSGTRAELRIAVSFPREYGLEGPVAGRHEMFEPRAGRADNP